MNLQKYKSRPRFYRVIGGGVHKRIKRLDEGFVILDTSDHPFMENKYCIAEKHVQEVVPKYEDGEWKPIKIGGNYLCVGDRLNGRKVWDYTWHGANASVNDASKNGAGNATPLNPEHEPFTLRLDVYNHEPRHQTTNTGEKTQAANLIDSLEYSMQSKQEAVTQHAEKINELVEAVNKLQNKI